MKKLLLIICLAFAGCQKEEPSQPKKTVKYYCFSETGDFTFKYTDLNGWQEKQFTAQQTYQVTVEVFEKDFGHLSFLTNTNRTTTDSLYIIAESEGKKVEKGFRFKNASAQIGVQLSELK